MIERKLSREEFVERFRADQAARRERELRARYDLRNYICRKAEEYYHRRHKQNREWYK